MGRGALAMIACVAVVAGCATPQHPRDSVDPDDRTLAARCARGYAALDAEVDRSGVRDGMTARVPGFPYLRVDRFLASYRPDALEPAAFAQWRDALIALDAEARRLEIANLPAEATRAVREALTAEGLGALPPAALLEGCSKVLAERDDADSAARPRLAAAARVPDDYDDTARAVGGYPINQYLYALAVRDYERSVRAAWALPPADLPQRGRRMTYVSADAARLSAADTAALLARLRDNPLRLPQPGPREAEQLLATHAPTFSVDEFDANDVIGRPAFDAAGQPTTVPGPVVFGRVARTRLGNDVLVQLVYTVWFPARPASFPGDPFAGRLDGLTWRVTLDRDGGPLVYDSIHPCGCYHLFVPTVRVAPRPPRDTIEEQALIVQTLPALPAGARVTLLIESGTHYLQRILVDAPDGAAARGYRIAADDALRSLTLPAGGTRSLFGPDGLVAGTERGERLFLWPLGIASAGAMRQWGRQPTAFIGRRHFDDADLLERYFTRAD